MPLKAMPVRSASHLFGDKDTLVISWDGTARNLRERVPLAVTARSLIERLLDYKKDRGWQSLPIYSDMKGDYTRAYISDDDGDVPAITVFTRRDGTVPTSGAGRWAARWPTRARTRAEPRTSTPCGRSLT
jgi:predicted dithiol-disulfide oxidoreductase (DUF899 family)